MAEMRTFRYKDLPPKVPLFHSLCWITMGHYWQIPGWAWGVLGVFLVAAWGIWLHWLVAAGRIDISVKEKKDG